MNSTCTSYEQLIFEWVVEDRISNQSLFFMWDEKFELLISRLLVEERLHARRDKRMSALCKAYSNVKY